MTQDAISVVISTFERPDACERALRSVLAQSERPLEVLVCDDGSRDDTPARFRAWARRCSRVRYLRTPRNTGTPAAARNLGIDNVRGKWIAFLDDDDEWLPGKLARQRSALVAEDADVIATNAVRSDGTAYFRDAPASLKPKRGDLLRGNPIITSTALVRRTLVRFPTARWMRGIEDYAAWLELADRGARFLVLGEQLVRYEDASDERLSAARVRRELAVARLAWNRARRRPLDMGNARALLRKSAGAIYVAADDGWRAARGRSRGR